MWRQEDDGRVVPTGRPDGAGTAAPSAEHLRRAALRAERVLTSREGFPYVALATIVRIVGIDFISLLTATIASTFITREREREELLDTLRAIERRLAALEER